MIRRTTLAAALAVLLVSAGCLGASSMPGADVNGTTDPPATDVATEPGATTAKPAETTARATGTPTESTVECPDDRDRFRDIAVAHVAEETGADPANVTVVNDAFVDYPMLGECYYSAKVRNRAARTTRAAFVAENGTVVSREAVEARADRVYERRYGNLSRELAREVGSADPDQRISVVVSVADINRTAAKQAVARENLTGAEHKEALSEEYERRAERKTEAVVAELREIGGVAVESVGSLRVRVRATPEAVRAIQSLDRVTWLERYEEPTTHLP